MCKCVASELSLQREYTNRYWEIRSTASHSLNCTDVHVHAQVYIDLLTDWLSFGEIE